MKSLIVIIIFVAAVWYFGFGSKDPIFQDYSGQSGSFLGSELCIDTSSQNPYQKGTQEYEGFAWGNTNRSSSCVIGNTAFKDGCLKQRQLAGAYHECIKNKGN